VGLSVDLVELDVESKRVLVGAGVDFPDVHREEVGVM